MSTAARDPGRTYIANPPASWLDDFLSWISPGLPHCCREDPQGGQCPPPDQYPCNSSATACADCATCFTTGSSTDPRVLPNSRPTLQQVSLALQLRLEFYITHMRCNAAAFLHHKTQLRLSAPKSSGGARPLPTLHGKDSTNPSVMLPTSMTVSWSTCE